MQMSDTDERLGAALRAQLARLGLVIATIQPVREQDAQDDGAVSLVTIQPGASVSYPSLEALVEEVVTGDIAVQMMDAGVEAGADDLGMVRFVTHMTEQSIALLLLAMLGQLAPGVPVPPLMLVRAIAPALTDLNTTSLHEACKRSRGAQLAVSAMQQLIDDGHVAQLGNGVVLLTPRDPGNDPISAYAQRCMEGVIYESMRLALDAGDGDGITDLLPHLLFVAGRSATAATKSSVHLALLCAAVFASIVPDEEAMGEWVTQACQLVSTDQIGGTAFGPELTDTFAWAFYDLAREAEAAHFLTVAQAAYLRAFELHQQLGAFREHRYEPPVVYKEREFIEETDWVVAEKALRLSLETGRQKDALYICAQVAQTSNLSELHEQRGSYLMALVNQAAGDLLTAQHRLEPIVASIRPGPYDLDERQGQVAYLYGAALTLAEIFGEQGEMMKATALIEWAEENLRLIESDCGERSEDCERLECLPDWPRHRLWIRLYSTGAQIALLCGNDTLAARWLERAYARSSIALGESARETRHIAALQLGLKTATTE